MRQIVSESLWQLALYRWLIGAFAFVAVTLAAIGLYAMIAYAASSRAQECAIRRALGSDPWRIVRAVLLVAGWRSAPAASWEGSSLCCSRRGGLATGRVA